MLGASAGGFDAIRSIIAGLPRHLEAAVFVVWHMAPDVRGILPDVLNTLQTLPAGHAIDHEPIRNGRIYVAPPDRHLLIENDHIRVTQGPKENRFRPAIDPLFRSAAFTFGTRVIGIVLSGGLDDGSAGLWTIKQRGGLAIVQDPEEADVPAMPQNALATIEADYILRTADIPAVLIRLVKEEMPKPLPGPVSAEEVEKTAREINIQLESDTLQQHVMGLGQLSPYTCPECHGVLTTLREGNLVRFRCHTGHAFSADSLLASLTENIESNLWNAIRSMQESILLLNHLGDHLAEANQPKLAAVYFKKAREAESRSRQLQQIAYNNESLMTAELNKQTKTPDNRFGN